MLTGGLGVDYTYMGGQWDNSKTLSFSIAPDGVYWDRATNVVNSQLNAEFHGTGWQSAVARALQTWAVATNLNFTPVSDSGSDFNASGVNQGDAKFGDIRVGGYNFGITTTIARTYGPPPNGQTGAGDVELNTNYDFSPGGKYDFQTILVHELGHSLGLGESPQPSSIMYLYYQGTRQALSPYDVEGIQSLYGARSLDAYQNLGKATTASTALDLSPLLGAGLQARLTGVSLATIGGVEYFSVVAPAVSGSTLTISAQARGYSLLSPKVTVVDATTGATVGSDAHPDQYGNLASVSIPNALAGHRYVVAVTGATSDVFAVGSYAIQAGFAGGTPIVTTPTITPTPTPPVAPIPAPAIKPDIFAYNNTFATATELGLDTQPTYVNLTLPSALNYQVFTFRTSRPGPVFVGALGATAVVVDTSAHNVAIGTGLLGFLAPKANSRYFLIMLSSSGAPVSNYAFAVRTPVGSTNLASASSIKAASVPVSIPNPAVPITTEATSVPRGPGKRFAKHRS